VGLLSFTDRWIRPPAELRKLFAGSERALAVAECTGGAGDATGSSNTVVIVATNLGLWLPIEPVDGQAGPRWRRVGWERVVKANWNDNTLSVIEGHLDDEGVVLDQPAVTISLTEPRNLPAVVRTRVEASIARSEQVNLPAGTGRIVARRVPGVDGLTWTARIDTGTPDSPADREVLLQYLTRAISAPTE
jgi:hypothetical protein